MPDVLDMDDLVRMRAEHVDNGSGRCGRCWAGDFGWGLSRASWPCDAARLIGALELTWAAWESVFGEDVTDHTIGGKLYAQPRPGEGEV